MTAVAAEIEGRLDLAGTTAIEDRLQDGAPETIAKIKEAGIRFWVLKGDKTETAVEIARYCNLFTSDMKLAFLTNPKDEQKMFDITRTLSRLFSVQQKLETLVTPPEENEMYQDVTFYDDVTGVELDKG